MVSTYKSFKILSWDALVDSISSFPYETRPVITFVPDSEFIEIAHKNNYFITILIEGTDNE